MCCWGQIRSLPYLWLDNAVVDAEESLANIWSILTVCCRCSEHSPFFLPPNLACFIVFVVLFFQSLFHFKHEQIQNLNSVSCVVSPSHFPILTQVFTGLFNNSWTWFIWNHLGEHGHLCDFMVWLEQGIIVLLEVIWEVFKVVSQQETLQVLGEGGQDTNLDFWWICIQNNTPGCVQSGTIPVHWGQGMASLHFGRSPNISWTLSYCLTPALCTLHTQGLSLLSFGKWRFFFLPVSAFLVWCDCYLPVISLTCKAVSSVCSFLSH